VRALSKLEKLFHKIRHNPKQVKFEELDKILIRSGFKKRQPRKGSSHFTYIKNNKIVTIPFEQPHIGIAYVKLAIKALEGEMKDD
jgi:predicted RNA binding protein YcfA (HicA-like mRNA interferase family)